MCVCVGVSLCVCDGTRGGACGKALGGEGGRVYSVQHGDRKAVLCRVQRGRRTRLSTEFRGAESQALRQRFICLPRELAKTTRVVCADYGSFAQG